METNYLAHVSEDGDVQTVADHLKNTAHLCMQFAESFGAAKQGQLIGLAHDIGKCSTEFQQRLQGGKIVDHASAGALECVRKKNDALWAACCIAGHHGGLPDVGNLSNDLPGEATLCGRLRKAISGGIPSYEMPVSLPEVSFPFGYGENRLTDSFLIRMLFSCLVDADYLDTEQFMTGGTVDRDCHNTTLELLEKLNQYIAPWWEPKNELNRLRCDVLRKCFESGNGEKGIYTLTVPTGGGKTIASMAYALSHAVANHMDRVIYVIPYTSIIEQTAEVFRKIFGENNVVEHHSNVVYEVGEQGDAAQYRQIRATENWDAPIIVTTAVQFYESLYSNRPSKCRKLHNIANSVIIFDEAQMIPAEHLRPCTAAIAELVKRFESTVVLCTATQPFLNDLLGEYAPEIRLKELCPNTSELFSKLRRVTFENAGCLDEKTVTAKMMEHDQVLCIVNSRKAAQKIYMGIQGEGAYHLSTLMCPMHRRAVLEEIRCRLKNGVPCRVVSTSLIEAGVDVDFPSVFREMAGLDSILQAAGRCNREGKRDPKESIVMIFQGISTIPQMMKVNIGAAKETLMHSNDLSAPETIEHYFKSYRSLMGTTLDKYGVVSAFENGIQGCSFPFRTIAERFHLIDDATKTIYIPYGDGSDFIRRLQGGERTRSLFRMLGQYSVSVYEPQYRLLLESGCLQPLEDETAVLIDTERYDQNLGLQLCFDGEKDLFK